MPQKSHSIPTLYRIVSKSKRSRYRGSILGFVIYVWPYLYRRIQQVFVFIEALFILLIDAFQFIKQNLVSRLFWGRGGLYRTAFHYVIIIFTVVGLVGSLAVRFSVNASEDSLVVALGGGPSHDYLQQGGNISSVLELDPLAPQVPIHTHIVEPGDTLAGIAEQYSVQRDTIRWANKNLISPFGDKIEVGWELKIPGVDGVLLEVRPGQTLADIVAKTEAYAYRSDIIELNNLVPPNYELVANQELFIPYGKLSVSEVSVAGIPTNVFVNPLSHPNCQGYILSRGYTSYHNGLDLARWPGCPVQAIATGEVIFAGWSPLAGFNVRIDHGGGIVSHYYHGDGTFWVKKGDRVQQGQNIMMMGTTGNSTGIHLHLSLFKNGVAVDPAPYVPY